MTLRVRGSSLKVRGIDVEGAGAACAPRQAAGMQVRERP